MKISTRVYALRLMLDLALSDPDQYVTIRKISRTAGDILQAIWNKLSQY